MDKTIKSHTVIVNYSTMNQYTDYNWKNQIRMSLFSKELNFKVCIVLRAFFIYYLKQELGTECSTFSARRFVRVRAYIAFKARSTVLRKGHGTWQYWNNSGIKPNAEVKHTPFDQQRELYMSDYPNPVTKNSFMLLG